jgi:MFS family permease
MDYLKLNNWSNQKISYYGHTRSWSQKGSAISSLIAGIIIYSNGNYESIFIYSIIPYIINIVLISTYPKELNLSLKQKKKTKKQLLYNNIKTFTDVISRINVLKIINTSAIHSAYLQAIKDYIQPLMINIALLVPFFMDKDIEKKNGIIVGIIYFFIYLLTSKASKVSSYFVKSSKKNIPYTTLLLGFSFGIITGVLYINNMWILSLLAFVIIYIVENIRKPILTGYISDNVPNDILTSVISAQSLLKTFLTAIFALLFGLLADIFGIGTSFIISSAVLLAISILSTFKR